MKRKSPFLSDNSSAKLRGRKRKNRSTMRSREQTSSFSLILPDINIKPTFQGSTDNLDQDVDIQKLQEVTINE